MGTNGGATARKRPLSPPTLAMLPGRLALIRHSRGRTEKSPGIATCELAIPGCTNRIRNTGVVFHVECVVFHVVVRVCPCRSLPFPVCGLRPLRPIPSYRWPWFYPRLLYYVFGGRNTVSFLAP